MPAPFNLAQFADATDKAIDTIVKKEAMPEPVYKKYYNFRTTEDSINKDSSISGLKEAEFTSENAQVLEDVPVQGFDQTYIQQQVDIMFPMSYQVYKFGFTKRKLTNFTNQIMGALDRKKEKLAAERLTNGFSTSYNHQGKGMTTSISLTGGDSLEPWNTSHTREDGGTGLNNVVYDGTTYSLPFDYAGYKAALRTGSLLTDPRGNPMPTTYDTLVCKTGSSVYFKAMEILAAIKKNEIPESPDNDGAGTPSFKVLQLDYLTNDAYWFMFDSKRALSNDGEYGFQHIESEPNNIDPVHIVAKTREMQIVGHSLFQQGFNDVARAWVASAGDSSTT